MALAKDILVRAALDSPLSTSKLIAYHRCLAISTINCDKGIRDQDDVDLARRIHYGEFPAPCRVKPLIMEQVNSLETVRPKDRGWQLTLSSKNEVTYVLVNRYSAPVYSIHMWGHYFA